MQVYLVGGAVRDKLLERNVVDNDYVVVGGTVDEMLLAGFQQVGADFPVFLHPVTNQEYALARTERKSGKGYSGFQVFATPTVTIEDDLLRRDLTINAMAIEVNGLNDSSIKTGKVIDPYGGQVDLDNKTLRHVSSAFNEDPLRVLRTARFYGRLASIGFTIAEPTKQLMMQICDSGELHHLSLERIWQESHRATMQQNPELYWQILYQVNALKSILPTLNSVWTNECVRGSINIALSKSDSMNLSMPQRWAILMSSFTVNNDISDAPLDPEAYSLQWLKEIEIVHKQLLVPKSEQKLAIQYAKLSHIIHRIDTLTATDIMALIVDSSAHKDVKNITQLFQVSLALGNFSQNSQAGFVATSLSQSQQIIDAALISYHSIGMKDIDGILKGKEIGDALQRARASDLSQRLKNIN